METCRKVLNCRTLNTLLAKMECVRNRQIRVFIFLIFIYLQCTVLCHAITDSGQLRLKGMHNGAGIVEVSHQSQWSLICANQWTRSDGDVACRQLGYEGVTRVMRVTPGSVGHHVDVDVVLNGTNCRGNESRLVDCPHSGFGNYSDICLPLKLPWVSCIGAEIPPHATDVNVDNEAEEDRSSNIVPMSSLISEPVITIAPGRSIPPITVQYVGSDRVTISWLHWFDRLRAEDPTAYRVRILIKYRLIEDPGSPLPLVGGQNFTIAAETPTYWTHYTVTGLEEQTNYEFWVESVRLSVMGGEVTEQPSDHVFVTTVCRGPQPVRELIVDNLKNNATTLKITWSMPDVHGCAAEDFLIEYQWLNTERCETPTTTGDQRNTRLFFAGRTSTTAFVITDLHPFSTYRVIVTAVNDFGRSRQMNATKKTGETVPSDVPLNIRHVVQNGGSRLKMSWDQPACGSRGGNIDTYSYMLVEVSTDAVTHRGDADREIVVLPEIDPLKRYKFLVAAKTSAGIGPFAVADIPIKPDILHICGRVQDLSSGRPRPSARISTGLTFPRGGAPWMAQLWSAGREKMFCGGSIINEYWILTAAHCVNSFQPSQLTVQLGDYDTDIPETHQRAYDVAQIIIHENFDEQYFDNDIALIKLADRIEFNDFVRPICFPTTKLAKSMLKPDRMGMVAGFGREGSQSQYPRYLKQVHVPVVERKTCRRSSNFGSSFTSNMFCAGYRQANRGDACSGDSGAPFAVRHSNDRWYVLGLVSWGEGCDMSDRYGYYTRLHRYTSWIKGHSKVTVK